MDNILKPEPIFYMELGLTNLEKDIEQKKNEGRYFTLKEIFCFLYQMISGLSFL